MTQSQCDRGTYIRKVGKVLKQAKEKISAGCFLFSMYQHVPCTSVLHIYRISDGGLTTNQEQSDHIRST